MLNHCLETSLLISKKQHSIPRKGYNPGNFAHQLFIFIEYRLIKWEDSEKQMHQG